MLCENCGKNQANTLIERSINGEKVRMHICSACAAKLGFTTFSNIFDFDIGSFLSGVMGSMPGSVPVPAKTERCPVCGSSLDNFTKRGKAGCAECYNTFRKQLLPMIMKLHGNVKHTGKIPKSADAALKKKRKKAELLKKLEAAVASQAFEEAAKLRDQIKALEEEGN
jgi:protein arginine kinase activator